MARITRREFYVSAAAATAAFGLGRHMAISAPAAKQKSRDPKRGFHRYKVGQTAIASRKKLLDRVVADKMRICGAHFPWPGVGRIAREGAGYAFTLA